VVGKGKSDKNGGKVDLIRGTGKSGFRKEAAKGRQGRNLFISKKRGRGEVISRPLDSLRRKGECSGTTQTRRSSSSCREKRTRDDRGTGVH